MVSGYGGRCGSHKRNFVVCSSAGMRNTQGLPGVYLGSARTESSMFASAGGRGGFCVMCSGAVVQERATY
jgi:hypothetical protein